MMIRWISPREATSAFALLMAVVAAVVLTPSAAQAAPVGQVAPAARAPYCGITWGSLDKTATAPVGSGESTVRNVRAGQHTCYDRLVVDLSGKARTATLRYVANVSMDGSGDLVPLRGGAKLQLVVQAPAYDENGHPTYVPADQRELVAVTGFRTFRQVAWAGSFEGQTTIGLGVRARLPMRVFLVSGPGDGSRVVLDVAHAW
jgi:hypothetical protein